MVSYLLFQHVKPPEILILTTYVRNNAVSVSFYEKSLFRKVLPRLHGETLMRLAALGKNYMNWCMVI